MEKLIEKINALALKEIEKYGGPSLPHYNLAILKGQELANKLGADAELVKAGVMLMDIKLGEAGKLGKPQEHISMGLEYTNEILKEAKISETKKEILRNCVLYHHGIETKKKGGWHGSLEAEICANADCYRFISPQGVFTYIQTVTNWGKGQNDAIDMVLAKLEEKHNVLSLPICKKELEPLYQQIKTLLLRSKI